MHFLLYRTWWRKVFRPPPLWFWGRRILNLDHRRGWFQITFYLVCLLRLQCDAAAVFNHSRDRCSWTADFFARSRSCNKPALSWNRLHSSGLQRCIQRHRVWSFVDWNHMATVGFYLELTADTGGRIVWTLVIWLVFTFEGKTSGNKLLSYQNHMLLTQVNQDHDLWLNSAPEVTTTATVWDDTTVAIMTYFQL